MHTKSRNRNPQGKVKKTRTFLFYAYHPLFPIDFTYRYMKFVGEDPRKVSKTYGVSIQHALHQTLALPRTANTAPFYLKTSRQQLRMFVANANSVLKLHINA